MIAGKAAVGIGSLLWSGLKKIGIVSGLGASVYSAGEGLTQEVKEAAKTGDPVTAGEIAINAGREFFPNWGATLAAPFTMALPFMQGVGEKAGVVEQKNGGLSKPPAPADTPATQSPPDLNAPAVKPPATVTEAYRTETERLASERAAQDKKEREKAQRERELAQTQKGTYQSTQGGAGADADKGAGLNIWTMINGITDMVNRPGMPQGFAKVWNWIVSALNTDTGRSIMMGLGVLTGIKTTMSVAHNVAAGNTRGATAAAVMGGAKTAMFGALAMQNDPNTPSLDDPKTQQQLRNGGDPYYASNDPVYDRGRNRGLDTGRHSSAQFNSAAGDAPDMSRRNEAPLPYGTRRDLKGPDSVGAAFNDKADPAIVAVAPPVAKVATPNGPSINDPEYQRLQYGGA